jgi:ferredoxin-NADP reductase
LTEPLASSPDSREPSAPAAAATTTAPQPPRRPKLKDMEAVVIDVVVETADSATLVLFTGNEPLDYWPGHFLTIAPQQFPALERFIAYFEDAKGMKEPPRAYSMASAPHEKYLTFTVKEETYVSGTTKYPPLLSPYLTYRVKPGMRLQITGFGGPYVMPWDIESRTDHVVHICAGSGIVPNFSMLKHALETGMKLRHTLIYGNKTWDDIIFRRQLEELARAYPDQLSLVHAISRETHVERYGGNVRQGRVSEALIREHIPDPNAVEVFTCGPGLTKWDKEAARETGETPKPRFLETTLEALKAIGVPKAKVHREAYG